MAPTWAGPGLFQTTFACKSSCCSENGKFFANKFIVSSKLSISAYFSISILSSVSVFALNMKPLKVNKISKSFSGRSASLN